MIFRKLQFFRVFPLRKPRKTCFDHNSSKSALQTKTQIVLKMSREDVQLVLGPSSGTLGAGAANANATLPAYLGVVG